MQRSLLLSCAVAFALGATCTAELWAAELILSDSFDRVEGFADDPSNQTNFSSWGDNDNAFGGTEVQTYTMDTSRGGGAQNTTDGSVAILRNGAAQINTDLGPLAPRGYTVAFDFQRTTGNGFVALGIGLDPSTIPSTGGFNANAFLFDTDATSDGAILVQQDNDNPGNGRLQLFNAGDVVVQQNSAFLNNEDTHSVLVTVGAPNGYGSGATGSLSVSIDGGAPVSSGITFDGENSGYLAFYSNQTGATVDNLVIMTIPEPTSGLLVSMLVAVGVSCARLRRN